MERDEQESRRAKWIIDIASERIPRDSLWEGTLIHMSRSILVAKSEDMSLLEARRQHSSADSVRLH